MDFEENIRIGKRIAALRRHAQLTQTEMAKRLEKPQSYVSKIESGERAVHLSEVKRIAASLERKPGYFMYYVLELREPENTQDDKIQPTNS